MKAQHVMETKLPFAVAQEKLISHKTPTSKKLSLKKGTKT